MVLKCAYSCLVAAFDCADRTSREWALELGEFLDRIISSAPLSGDRYVARLHLLVLQRLVQRAGILAVPHLRDLLLNLEGAISSVPATTTQQESAQSAWLGAPPSAQQVRTEALALLEVTFDAMWPRLAAHRELVLACLLRLWVFLCAPGAGGLDAGASASVKVLVSKLDRVVGENWVASQIERFPSHMGAGLAPEA